MELNHANLCTSDLAALAGIFARHFGLQVEQTGVAGHASRNYAPLHGSDGFFLVMTGMEPGAAPAYPADFHVGFTVDDAAKVRDEDRELTEGGCLPEPIKEFESMERSWTAFYCAVGDGIRIEVNAHTWGRQPSCRSNPPLTVQLTVTGRMREKRLG